MSDIVSSWSPARAVLPPDPDGHNRMLDRGAAEHLREVAPGLAPDADLRDALMGTASHFRGQPLAPAPPAEATNPVKTLSALLVAGGAKLVTRLTAAQACDVVREIARQNGHDVVIEAPAPGATGEMSDSVVAALVGMIAPQRGEDSDDRYSRERAIKELLDGIAALRARAREAEERAEMYVRLHRQECIDGAARLMAAFRERDEARRLIAGVHPDDRSALAVNILRAWPRAEIETFARHLLGDSREQESLLLGQLQTQLEIVTRERDEARERVAAEAEVKRLNDVVDGHARDSARAGLERDRAEHRLKLATEEIVRVRLAYDDPSLDATDGAHPAWWRGNDAGVAGAVRIVNEALDEALPLAGCVGGADLERVRQRIAALRERCKALESDRASLLERWVTKADAPAAGGGR